MYALTSGASVGARQHMAAQPLKAGARLSTARRGGAVIRAATFLEVPAKYSKLEPTGERLFVKCDEAQSQTAGGVLLPEASAEKATSGSVVGAGAGCKQVAAGDTILYSKFGLGSTMLQFQDEEHLLLKEEDVVGVLPSGGDIPDLKPVGDRVLVQPLAADDSSKGGVLLPESAKEKPATGMVLAVGPGGKKDKMKLKVGDKVVFFKYAGEKMKARTGKLYVMLRQGDIFGSLN